MPRLQFELPDDFAFSTELEVYFSHLNWANHLDNAQLLTLVGEGRVRFFRALGYAESDIEGGSIVVADQLVLYRAEAFHGETLVLSMTPCDFNKRGFDLVWQIRKQRGGLEVARGKLGIVFIDLGTKRPVALPQAFLSRLRDHGFVTSDEEALT